MPQTSVSLVRPLQHIQVPQLVWLSDPEHFRGETDVPCRLTASARIKPNQIFTPGVHIHGVGSGLTLYTTYPETPYQQRGHNLPPTPNRQPLQLEVHSPRNTK